MGSRKPISQQVIVVTGASSGIGLATAQSAARQGAKVVFAARSGHVLCDIVERLNARGSDCMAVVADVGDRLQVERIVLGALERFGRIDTWVNNAGVSIYGRLEEVSEEDSRRLFDTNFWGVVHGSLAVLPCLKSGGGTLINVGSEVSDAVIPLQGMYSASKHAVKGFNDALRVELEVEKSSVSVVLVQPTAVNTPFPHHARNYMDHEPKLPDPMIDAEKVAEAILDAAVHPRRYIKVGAMSRINTAVAKIAPSLADKMSAREASRQHLEEKPRCPKGTLYSPSEESCSGQFKSRSPGSRT